MTCHFTYVEELSKEDLRQGDLLRRSNELDEVLGLIHPHYLKPDYLYFIVLTQSCDLVRRNDKSCKAKYINLAAVRPFSLALQRKALDIQKNEFERHVNICRKNKRTTLQSFLKNVLDNNHSEYFYLHDDNELDLHEPCVVFLRLSIGLRSDEHYEKCLKAKFLELNEEFRAKLGWLTGNMYSRIGTRDWAVDTDSRKQFNNMISDILDRNFIWLDSNSANAINKYIVKENLQVDTMHKDDINRLIESPPLPPSADKKQQVLKSIKKIIMKSEIEKEIDVDRLLKKIENDTVFKSFIK